MEVVVAAVAEHAWEENGSLSVCKIFDTVNFPKLPFSLPRLSIALRFLFEAAEAGTHFLNVVFEDETGHQILNANGEITLAVSKENRERKYSLSFVINGQNVMFKSPGTHLVKVSMDDMPVVQIPVYIVEKAGDKISLH